MLRPVENATDRVTNATTYSKPKHTPHRKQETSTDLSKRATIRAQCEGLRDQREEATTARELTDFNSQNPPKFKGEHDPDKDDLWIQEIENFFEMLLYTVAKKVEYATFLLRAEVESWWRGAKQQMESNNEALN
ncbi:hypothetical protein KIW84_045347 [Lathyrus oleraceus]|uniref:Uncharacterized protein n=1 Tax=Pisum sativum TaxID=3888 RepID=A0A9D5AU35_PEA|nr:hypothetical protein KIW84_045347 [Pisum sativum]